MGKATGKLVYTDNQRAIVAALQGAESPMTLAALSEVVGFKVQPGTVTALINRGNVAIADEKVEVERPTKRTHKTYSLITVEPTAKADGKVNAYSDTEKAILGALQGATEPMSLAAIGEALGLTLTSGNINGLVSKGNVEKVGEVEVMGTAKSKVNAYVFAAAIAD